MNRPLLFLIILVFMSAACAQPVSPTPVLPPATPAPSASPAEAEIPTVAIVDPDFASPAASMQSFIEAMAQAGPLRPDLYLKARHHLDLSKVPAVMRDEQGLSLSQQLYDILNQTPLDFSALVASPDQTKLVIYGQGTDHEIALRRQSDGRWLVDQASVALIPSLYESLGRQGKIQVWRLTALDFEFLGLNGNVWLALLLLPGLSYLVGSLTIRALRRLVVRWLPNPKFAEAIKGRKTLRPLGWLVASLVFWIGISALDLPLWLLLILSVVVKILATVSAIITAYRVSDSVAVYMSQITATTSSRVDDMLIPLARRSFKTLVAVLGLLFLAQNLDIEVWSFFAGFSIFGAMIALAGQDLLKNFFGSIMVLVDQPFAVGDWIVVEGVEGVVEDVGFRSTRIRTFYDSLVTLPNSKLIVASVDNYGARKFRRYTKKLPVRWSTSPRTLETFCEGIRELVRSHPYTRKDSYQIWVNDMSDYALEILLYVFWEAPDWNTELRERHRFLVDVHRLATELGVEFAYPVQNLQVNQVQEPNSPPSADNFDLKAFEEGQVQGREATRNLLRQSLPKDKPPPAVAD